MARSTPKGLHVWDLETDKFDHSQLAANWDLLDNLVDNSVNPPQRIQILSALPTTGNFAGRLCMLSAANGGYNAWTLCRYDGSNWQPVKSVEVQASLPTQGNFAGRTIMLSASVSNFPAWTLVRYDGSNWDYASGFTTINTGSGSTNILGKQQTNDLYINTNTRGLVLIDRTTGLKKRIFVNNGALSLETVT